MTSLVQPLFNKNIFPLRYPNKFAWTIGTPLNQVTDLASNPESHYRPYLKKVGKKIRTIHNPNDSLKVVQSRINKKILQKFEYPDFLIGGIPGKKLEDHVILHVRKPMVVTLDIQDCYPSISYRKVYRVFTDHFGAHPETARIATKLTTYQGGLPLGAPTSTLLANLVLLPTLRKIKESLDKNGFDISQYIDDMAFSGGDLPNALVSEICKEFSRINLTMGRDKIFVMHHGRSQVVTKRKVNRKINVTRKKLSQVRSSVHDLVNTPRNHKLYKKKLASVKGRNANIRPGRPRIAKKLLEKIR